MTETTQTETKTEELDVCGCMTFGGILFIMTTLVFLTTNDAAQAFINVVQ